MANKINIAQTSELLGVSSATIRNWVRHKYLSRLNEGKDFLFEYKEVKVLQESIANGDIVRLNKRANKRNSTKMFVPTEYVGEESFNQYLINVTDYIIRNSLEISQSVFLLSLNLLIKEKLVLSNNFEKLLLFQSSDYKNNFLLNILKEFHDKLRDFSKAHKYEGILNLDIPSHPDVLGLLYQSIKSEGEKAKQGSYYTPKNIVDDILSDYVQENFRVLDPCCGTGQFILNASDFIQNPKNIYGFDIDPIAVFIAKLNLIIKHRSIDFNPQIFQIDTLLEIDNSTLFSTNKFPSGYNLIITNPPWGLHFENATLNALKSIYSNIKSIESFSFFLSKSIDMLEDNGILSFILPESILNIKVHSDIRKMILKNTSILKIVKLGRAFTNVFTNVIRIDLKKNKPIKEHKINMVSDSNYSIEQDRFWSNPDVIFDIDVNDFDKRIIEKVFRFQYSTLKNNAEWALGIVTGDNKKYIHSRKQNEYEEIYKGKDVNKYLLSPAHSYIKFQPDKFQQVAPVKKYRATEKLIYKFISNKLVFAYDNKQKLTLNSANILIPNIKNYPIKVVLALLNSSLYQFIYLKKFNTIKVLRGNLEELPFPHFSKANTDEIITLVDEVLLNKIDYTVVDDFIIKLFQITDAEKEYIKKNV